MASNAAVHHDGGDAAAAGDQQPLDVAPPYPNRTAIDPETMALISVRDEPSDPAKAFAVVEAKCRVAHDMVATLLAERDALVSQISNLNSTLALVQSAAATFTQVQQPVVASDGYTYEQSQMADYVEACLSTGTQPVSQLTQAPLQPLVFPPNRTLFQVLKCLAPLEPVSVRPLAELPPLGPPPASFALSSGAAAEGNRGLGATASETLDPAQ